MEHTRSADNYKIFLENEGKMASVLGASHLWYLRKSKENVPPFDILPSATTLIDCIRVLNAYIEGSSQKLPSTKTFHKITEFFKRTYQLSEPNAINEATLFEYHMEEILAKQGLTELKAFESSYMKENWFAGNYYGYYEQYSASKEFNGALYPIEIKGAILKIFETKGHLYDAVMITGFSSKEQMEKATRFIWKSNSNEITNVFSTYESYLENKSSLEKTIFFWSGKVEEQRNQIHGKLYRKSKNSALNEQEISFSLFKHSSSEYDSCQGAIGVMVMIRPQEEIGSSKLMLSKNSFDWKRISAFLEKKQKRLSFFRNDDRDFLNIILAADG